MQELVTKKKLFLFSGRTHLPLAEEIAGHLDERLGEAHVVDFPNGEIHCKLGESVRGADVFIIQTHAGVEGRSVNDSLMEQLIMIDAAKRASAKRIIAVCPFYGYARQDRKATGREPITAKLVADLFISAGIGRMVSVDLHVGQIQGFFDVPVDHVPAMPLLVRWLEENLAGEDLVIVAPDGGRVKVADRYAQALDAELAVVYKRRSTESEVETVAVVGDVADRTCVLVDDMIDTAGTICSAAEEIAARGAAAVYAVATHGVFSGPAIDRLKNSALERVVVTNSLPLPPEKRIDRIEVLSIAAQVAESIDAVFEDTSVSELFDGQNQT